MIELRASSTTLVVDERRGARAVSLTFGGDEVLGSSTPEPGDLAGFYDGAFLLAPFAGRLPAAGVAAGRRRIALEPTHRDGHVDHGLVHSSVWTVVDRSDLSVTLETRVGEPWVTPARARIRWSVAEDRIAATLRWDSELPGPVVLGWHPWFREELRGSRGSVILDGGRWVDGAGRDTAPPPPPRDAVVHALRSDPVVVWPGVLGLRLESAQARAWIVCETFPGAFCVEPLSDLPTRLGHPDGARRHATLSWSVSRVPAPA